MRKLKVPIIIYMHIIIVQDLGEPHTIVPMYIGVVLIEPHTSMQRSNVWGEPD